MEINLGNLGQATEQEVFDQVAKHLMGPLPHRVVVRRLYRDSDRSCAAGCLIADSEYDEAFEGNIWTDLVKEGQVPSHHAVLIRELQILHDTWSPSEWPAELAALASEYSLNADAISA